ncbi:MAG: hypothetical protein QGH95_04620, partial [Candidatus Nitrosopelagicus sp.]|nr:hypothetical protein [Candidatus Nitrosopelagicus sp.]
CSKSSKCSLGNFYATNFPNFTLSLRKILFFAEKRPKIPFFGKISPNFDHKIGKNKKIKKLIVKKLDNTYQVYFWEIFSQFG